MDSWNGWTDRWIVGMDGGHWMNERTDGWMDGWMDGRPNGWKNKRTDD